MKKITKKIKMIEYLFLAISVLTSSISLLYLKKLSNKLDFNEGSMGYIKLLFNRYSFLTILFVVISIIFYTLALSKTTLAFAYSFNSINIILVVMGGYLFYKEKINKKHLIGIILIILGLFLFNF